MKLPTKLNSHSLISTAIIVSLIFLFSCADPVYFEEPQPRNGKDLKSFPTSLRGNYIDENDYTLTVTKKWMVKWANVKGIVSVDSFDIEIDSTEITDENQNRIVFENESTTFILELRNDSVDFDYQYHDTLFQISELSKLRKFKGHYLLNQSGGNNQWLVTRISIDKKGLAFSKLSLDDNFETLSSITPIKVDSTSDGNIQTYHLNPKRKSLKKLYESGFKQTDYWTKVK